MSCVDRSSWRRGKAATGRRARRALGQSATCCCSRPLRPSWWPLQQVPACSPSCTVGAGTAPHRLTEWLRQTRTCWFRPHRGAVSACRRRPASAISCFRSPPPVRTTSGRWVNETTSPMVCPQAPASSSIGTATGGLSSRAPTSAGLCPWLPSPRTTYGRLPRGQGWAGRRCTGTVRSGRQWPEQA
jgi:hypothetical protein